MYFACKLFLDNHLEMGASLVLEVEPLTDTLGQQSTILSQYATKKPLSCLRVERS